MRIFLCVQDNKRLLRISSLCKGRWPVNILTDFEEDLDQRFEVITLKKAEFEWYS